MAVSPNHSQVPASPISRGRRTLRAPRRVVGHDHRFDPAGGLRVDDVQVGEVAEVEEGPPRAGAARPRRSAEDVEARQVGLAGSGEEAAIGARRHRSLEDGADESRRDGGGDRLRLGEQAAEGMRVEAGQGGESGGPREERATAQAGHGAPDLRGCARSPSARS